MTDTVPNQFEQMSLEQRRRILHRVLARTAVAVIAVAVLYAIVPLPDRPTVGSVIGLIAGLAALASLVIWQFRSILRSPYPGARAVEAIVAVVSTLVVVFAYTYAGMSATHPESFSEPLSRIDSLYYAVTILSTVGFGDITAVTDAARLTVTAQIVLDLVVVVGIVRLLLAAAKRETTAA